MLGDATFALSDVHDTPAPSRLGGKPKKKVKAKMTPKEKKERAVSAGISFGNNAARSYFKVLIVVLGDFGKSVFCPTARVSWGGSGITAVLLPILYS
jgi:hypothetical protein